LNTREPSSLSRSLFNGTGALLALSQFPGKVRLSNLLGRVASRFTPEADCQPLKGAWVTVSLSDRIGRLMWTGCYERELVRLLERVLDSGMAFVDIGAQIGYFSVTAAARVGKSGAVYSFEPDPDCYSNLVRNGQHYPWIKAYNSVVADFTGHVSFYRSPKQGESGWGAIFNDDGKRAEVKVQACSLDGWATATRPERIDFIKVDVEGAECRVLDGARSLIAKTRPLLWVEANEVCLSRDGKSVSLLLQQLVKLDYVPEALGDRRSHSVQNIVAVPKEKTELFARIALAGVELFDLKAISCLRTTAAG
jgi:FkbM family methyltransferase